MTISRDLTNQTNVNPSLRTMQITTMSMLILAGLVNNLDRSALSIANSMISEELHISAAGMGVLMSAFSLVYAFSQLPIGIILDRLGARLVLGWGLIVWSSAQVFCGLANSFSHLFIGRALLGAGESPHYPASAKAVSEWFSAEKRGGPTSLFLIAGTIAPALAPPLLTFLMLSLGWRWMFMVLGGIGIALGIAWLTFYRNREDFDSKLGSLHGDAVSLHSKLSLREWGGLFRQRNTWAMVFGSAGVIYMIWLYMSWLPAYLQHERHVSLALTGWLAAIPYALGTLGQLSCGTLVDWLVRRGFSISASRKLPICAGLIGAGVATLFAAYLPTTTGALIAISVSMFCIYFANVGTWALVGVMVDTRLVATMGSLLTFGGYLGGSAAPIITGILVDQTGSFAFALSISAVLAFAAALIYLFGIKLDGSSAK
ncbi:MAG: MFS transporter [Pseudomonas sp. PGPPP1]|uniref:MFS transporter n=1 Tax=unclassified Pseudomonas TaxID=196821 RepID=UPI000BDBE672|nr:MULTISPECIES: MFS transporter [unclassified Pseudomonas]OYU07359.1 MAG: MFS transporter [Pseudomonas sp. PGPPP1]